MAKSVDVTYRCFFYILKESGKGRRVWTDVTRKVRVRKDGIISAPTEAIKVAAKKKAAKVEADFGQAIVAPLLGYYILEVDHSVALCDVCETHRLGDTVVRTECGRLVHADAAAPQVMSCWDVHMRCCLDCEEK